MSIAKTLLNGRMPTSHKALFVMSVMFLNMALSTLSSVSVYAETNETNTTEVDPEVVAEEIPEEIPTEEIVEDAPAEEVVVVEETVEPTVEEVPIVVATVEEFKFSAEFDCWIRNGLTDYTAYVSYTSDQVQNWAAGTDNNKADPIAYNPLLPVMFGAGSSTAEITSWNGTSFDWLVGQEVLTISLEGDQCSSPTIFDIVEDHEALEAIEDFILTIGKSTRCSKLLSALGTAGTGPYTLFAPTDPAIASLIAAPGTIDGELAQLYGNPDELCALIGSHIAEGEIVSTDATTDGILIPSIFNDMDGIFFQLVDGLVYADGALVSEPDLFASNGVVHIVDSVLLPQSVGTIDPIVTDKTSPALSGTIDTMSLVSEATLEFEYCVVVRINGVPYLADVDGNIWNIAEGMVSLNPTEADTLFDVVVRLGLGQYFSDEYGMGGCEEIEIPTESPSIRAAHATEVVTHGGELLGLSMSRSVLSFLEPEEPEEETGEVLGETTEEVVVEEPVVVAAQTCGKGLCGTIAQADQQEVDTDGDGVPDSEDPDPNDPSVTGLEDTSAEDTTDDSSDGGSDDTNVFLWFLVGGGVVVVWYLLWQRSGREL